MTPAVISQDENGAWSMSEMTVLGESVTEEYDPEVQYGFWIPPEELVTDREEDPEQFHANVDFFDGAGADSDRHPGGRLLAVQRLPPFHRTAEGGLGGGRHPASAAPAGRGGGPLSLRRLCRRSAAQPLVFLAGPGQPGGEPQQSLCTAGGRAHTGVDIPAPEGEVILAAADGTVTETGFDPERGNYVVLDHGQRTDHPLRPVPERGRRAG